MKRKIAICVMCMIALVLLFTLPYPQKINIEYDGIANSGSPVEEIIPVHIEMKGTLKNYLIKEDVYEGKFSISLLPYTEASSCKVSASVKNNVVSHLMYLCEDGYQVPGYFVPIEGFNTLYIRIISEDNKEYEIYAPAADSSDADEIRKAAQEYLSWPLPNLSN
ncbi:MAG: hypothetical protein IJX67_03515 [Oscillospiraceae bacterium]|nr:hypothetical protein [Clostridia bacterium]MBQ9167463.1 hypothetical protein [Oscillospiraceae bacterium]